MKNFKSILNFLKLDLTAIQIFISVIAIFFAGIVNSHSVSAAKLDSYKPSQRAFANETSVCSVAYVAACDPQIQEAKSCKIGKVDVLQVLSIPKLAKPNVRPICSSPNEVEHRSPLSQNG